MRPLFLHYPQCGTCRKAVKWLKENSIEVDARHIVEENPTVVELTEWIPKSGLPISKFFNTSGQVYRQNNLKEVMKTASDSELIQLLSENGMFQKKTFQKNNRGKTIELLILFINLPKVSRQNIQENERNIWRVYPST